MCVNVVSLPVGMQHYITYKISERVSSGFLHLPLLRCYYYYFYYYYYYYYLCVISFFVFSHLASWATIKIIFCLLFLFQHFLLSYVPYFLPRFFASMLFFLLFFFHLFLFLFICQFFSLSKSSSVINLFRVAPGVAEETLTF